MVITIGFIVVMYKPVLLSSKFQSENIGNGQQYNFLINVWWLTNISILDKYIHTYVYMCVHKFMLFSLHYSATTILHSANE